MQILVGFSTPTEENNKIILLINGGDKSKQSKDIEKAHEFLEQWRIKND